MDERRLKPSHLYGYFIGLVDDLDSVGVWAELDC